MNNLENVGDSDFFDKKLYILDNSTNNIDNEKKEFNITGIIDEKNFNYENLNLTISSITSNDKLYIIPCKVINNKEKNYTLKCNSNEDIKANIDGAFSNLGNENLIINYLDNSNNKIYFNSSDPSIKNINYVHYQKNKKGLSTGGIVAIIVSSIATLAIVATVFLCCLRNPRKPLQSESNNNTYVKNNLSYI